jgi:hypothetical protein
MAAPQ